MYLHKKNFEWTGVNDKDISSTKQVMKDKKGSSGDLNLLLASMLDKAEIDVTMVLLSTRDHGFIRESYPMQKQFNYAVCMVRLVIKPCCSMPLKNICRTIYSPAVASMAVV